jgi:bifunctional enzyme CysN/CysC
MKKDNLPEDLLAYENRELLRFITCGSVDDGKSTLIGRLLHDSQLLYDDQLAEIRKESQQHKSGGAKEPELDLSLVLDGLLAEREQGITIDVAYRYFTTARRKFIIADCPGHEQYTRNMVTGASHAGAALILIDASKGVLTQTLRHTVIVNLLGIEMVIVVVNKLDLTDFREDIFSELCQLYREKTADKTAFKELLFVPVSALCGDNVVDLSANMPWYKGRPLLEILENLPLPEYGGKKHFRLPVQYVNRLTTGRGYCGNVCSGNLATGDEIIVLPSGKRAFVKELYSAGDRVDNISDNMAVTLVLDRELDISRGDLLVAANEPQPEQGDCIDALLVWMDEEPLSLNRMYDFKRSAGKTTAYIDHIYYRLDVNSGEKQPVQELQLNETGLCRVNLSGIMAVDSYRDYPVTGSFVLIDRISNFTCGAGLVQALQKSRHVQWHEQNLSREDRIRLKGHKPLVFWLTGLSGSGKSTIANALEEKLHSMGIHTYLLDGDNIRHGLNKDLGFSEVDRAENIRRVAEVAKLFTDAGLVVIVSFISPFTADREKARNLFPKDEFMEIFVDAPLEVCRKRDPKGFYEKAEKGLIKEFTGLSAPYEKPAKPEIHIRTDLQGPDDCVETIFRFAFGK